MIVYSWRASISLAVAFLALGLLGLSASATDLQSIDSFDLSVTGAATVLEEGCTADLTCTCPTVRCTSSYACWKRYGDGAVCVSGCCDTLL
jgi:hypothetical protein